MRYYAVPREYGFRDFFIMLSSAIVAGPYLWGRFDKYLSFMFENKIVRDSFIRIGLLVPVFVVVFILLSFYHS